MRPEADRRLIPFHLGQNARQTSDKASRPRRTQCQFHVYLSSPNTVQADDFRKGHIMVFHLVSSHFIQFFYRSLIKPSSLQEQFPWKDSSDRTIFPLVNADCMHPVLHPANHHSPAVRRQDCLRCIKINPIVDGLIMLLCKSPRLLVILSDQAECSVSVWYSNPSGSIS